MIPTFRTMEVGVCGVGGCSLHGSLEAAKGQLT